MRVMVSLNLADIMTATRPITPQPVYEIPKNDPGDPSQNLSFLVTPSKRKIRLKQECRNPGKGKGKKP